MNRIKIVGVAASLRSRCNEDKMRDAILNCKDRSDLDYIIEKMSFNKMLSNSEACLLASLFGVQRENGNFEIIRLNRFFQNKYPSNIAKDKKLKLLDVLSNVDGYIFSTPVYFGDSSSYLKSFFDFLNEHNLLKNKIVGVDSVGAKRNGGQETTNIFTLSEALKNGAIICGNGPKISQYGGTAWAGDIGSIREDTFGIETSFGVGKKVSQIAKIYKLADKSSLNNFKVSFWITKDKDSVLEKNIEARIEKLKRKYPSWINFEITNLTKIQLKRCLGCSICPFYLDKSDKYGIFKDRIQNDDLKDIYENLINTNAIIVAGLNPINSLGVKDIYQIFMERTRQIRRDNFLLTNVPVAAYSLEEIGQGYPFTLKVMSSFLRHNTVILPPIEQYYNNNNEIANDPHDILENFIDTALRIHRGKKHVEIGENIYEPVGYSYANRKK
jgi:multimeric flavodoxin WrbA